MGGQATAADELLLLEDALQALSQLSPRQATMVEARFFGGLDMKETAELLGVSEATILRDWRAARAWCTGSWAPTHRSCSETRPTAPSPRSPRV